jgi:RNA polymerase sigma-70 factor (ECF subfamily)
MSQELDKTVRLLSQYRGGDDGALNVLYQRYFDRIHAVVRLRMGAKIRGKAESVDIVQDAFLASLRGLERFNYRSEGDFFHWLCKVTENRIRDQADFFAAQRRDAGRERPIEAARPSGSSVFGPIHELARFTTPATQVARAEDLQRLEHAVDQLPEAQREALLLVRYEGLSFAEAGEQMQRKPDAVRMLVARAMVALAKRLGGSRPAEGTGDRNPDR